MLIDFTFENYLSFKDQATISLVVPRRKDFESLRYMLEVENGKYALSPFAVIYGQNAAGKSNVIKALNDFVNLVLYSHSLGIDAPIPSYKPYKLDSSSKTAPVMFEAEFVAEGVRYLYKVIFDRNAILKEGKSQFLPVRRGVKSLVSLLPERSEGCISKKTDRFTLWWTSPTCASRSMGLPRSPTKRNPTESSQATTLSSWARLGE